MSRPIEDYALIGDTRTVGLVSKLGSIDWLCVPRFDSGACFAALLGEPRHGRWSLAPESETIDVRRRYRDGTLVLETEMTTAHTTTSTYDLRPGGVWRFVMHGPDGRDYQNRITFGEIVPNERLTWRHDGGEDAAPITFKQTLTFEDVGGKTRLTWRGEFGSAEERARVIRDYGADKGLVQTMSRLADYVAQLKA